MTEIEDKIKNVQNEILVVGAIYRKPELLVEYSYYVKSKYDMADEVCRFLYDNAEIIFQKRTQSFNQNIINLYMSEDKERFELYKKYGGWNTIEDWMGIADPLDFKNYFDIMKKYSLIREYHREGYNVEKIINHKKFELFSPDDIYNLIRSKVDRVRTVIMKNNDIQILNDNMADMVNGCLEKPDMGIAYPYPILNDLLRGARKRTMIATGMTSNSGKSRYMFTIIAHMSLYLKQKVLVLLNEMSIQDMKYCLLTTVINNDQYKELHKIDILKNEREITLGLYRGKDGNYIYRNKDNDGNFNEPLEDYINRLEQESEEYIKVKKIAKWIEKETDGIVFAKDMSTGYTDKDLEFEIRKAHMVYGIEYFFYDTLKSETANLGEWASLQATATKLKELTNELNIYLYASIQLTPDVNLMQPLEMNAMNIASCKSVKNILDVLWMFKEVDKKDYHKYCYLVENGDDWGEPEERQLDLNKRLYIAVSDKIRTGSKKNLLFELDLNQNRWVELGEVFRK